MKKYEHFKLLLVLNVIAVILYNIASIIRSDKAIPIIISVLIIVGEMCILFDVLRHRNDKDSDENGWGENLMKKTEKTILYYFLLCLFQSGVVFATVGLFLNKIFSIEALIGILLLTSIMFIIINGGLFSGFAINKKRSDWTRIIL